MESANVGAAQDKQREGWTVFELLLLTPFAFLLWYAWNEPLVVQRTNEIQPAATTVEQRIAPVAQIKFETTPAAAVETPVLAPVKQVAFNEPAPATKQQKNGIQIEIADATGVEGFAGALAQALEGAGMSITKTASATQGSQRRTVIVYRKGLEEEARRLGALFNHPPALVAAKEGEAGIRLVLGSMAVRDKLALVRDVASVRSNK